MNVKETTDEQSAAIFNVMTDDQAEWIAQTLNKRDGIMNMKTIDNIPFERKQMWIDPNYPYLTFKVEELYTDGSVGVYILGEGVEKWLSPIRFNSKGEVVGSQFKPFKLTKLLRGSTCD